MRWLKISIIHDLVQNIVSMVSFNLQRKASEIVPQWQEFSVLPNILLIAEYYEGHIINI